MLAWPSLAVAEPAAPRAENHWAYIAPQRPALPAVRHDDWPHNPIDHFVLTKLEAQRLRPSPPAERAKLLRRVYLDLVGLPPSPQAVEAFVNDTDPNAYEKIVDRLLASPRYGERWARPWLDLARYADSNGFQADQLRDAWAYRDWVIAALNADMPFDRFTVEQLAGDLLAEEDQGEGGKGPDAESAPSALGPWPSALSPRIATGFHRTVTCNVEAGVDPEANRVNQVMDRVNTTATVWLGSTFECAQCHDHKYDPFTMRDYYSLFAYFNNTPIEVKSTDNRMVSYDFYGPTMQLPLTPEQQAQKSALQSKLADARARLNARTEQVTTTLPQWEARVAASLDEQPAWHVLDVASFESSGGASHTILEDKSVLVGGDRPDKDVYTVTVRTNLKKITGFKLEALTHESLPGNGPGRHHPERPNFVLYAFTVEAAPAAPLPGGRASSTIELHSPTADFSQPNWDVAGLIDGDASTGWAINPQFGKPHHAAFLTRKPAGFDSGTMLTFRFDQHYGGCRTIGRLRLSAMTGDPGAAQLPGNVADALRVPADQRTANQRQALVNHLLDGDAKVKQLREQVAGVEKQIAAIRPHTTLVMIEQDEPRDTHVLARGDWQSPGKKVQPSPPTALHALPADAPRNRLGLARWLVSRDNPLTARVTVNRWWAEFFGTGLVATEEDFGTQGERPSHPDLLDWLAVEFMQGAESGPYAGAPWSTKRIHKLIVMSATYQQDSRITDDLLRRDPGNRLLARGPRVRMSAETIRDNALAIAGLLSDRMGGPPVYPPQPDNIWRHVGRNAPKWNVESDADRFRRGVYVVWRRSAPYPSFVNFDAPDRAACVVKRSRTNTPLQALTLMNDEAFVEMAVAFARRIAAWGDESPGVDARIAYAFRCAVSREPGDEERAVLRRAYEAALKQYTDDPAAAKALLSAGHALPKHGDDGAPPAELAAWFRVASILLNLDETITKG